MTFARRRPIALVLPCLYSELHRPALDRIVRTLQQVPYLDEVVIALGGASATQFRHARDYFAPLARDGRRVRVLWNGGPRMQKVYRVLDRHGVQVPGRGKGRAAWAAYGYVLSAGHAHVIIEHDSDILTYDREIPARLAYPIANPDANIAFCKGYYARTSDRLHGRVMRLFVTPVTRALRATLDDPPFLRYLDSYRYALAGEFAMDVDLARRIRMPGDWGLEVGMLAEVYRETPLEQICQVDIADAYDHKHQALSGDDPRRGLQKMAIDIARSLFRTLRAEGIPLDARTFRAIGIAYRDVAHEFITRYEIEAQLNGLSYDRGEEQQAVEVFAEALDTAARNALKDPRGSPWIPSWRHVVAKVPRAFDLFYDAVEADNAAASKPPLAQART